MNRRAPLLAAVAATLALAACATAQDEPAGTASPTSQAGGDAAAVEIDDFAFDPGTVEVAAGTTVTWSNEDATSHTVTAGTEDAPEVDRFDLDVDEKGQTVTSTFDTPGTYVYFCEIHPFMTGTIEVTEPA